MTFEGKIVKRPDISPEEEFANIVQNAIARLCNAKGFDAFDEPFPDEAYEQMDRAIHAFCIYADEDTKERMGVGNLKAKLFVMRNRKTRLTQSDITAYNALPPGEKLKAWESYTRLVLAGELESFEGLIEKPEGAS